MASSRNLLLAIMVVASATSGEAFGQVNEGDLFATESFEQLFYIDVQNRLAHDLLSEDLGSLRNVVATGGSVFVADTSDIWRVDVGNNAAFQLNSGAFTFLDDMTNGTGNSLVVASSDGIQSIDTSTGNVTDIYDNTFFSPDGVVVSKNGDIFVTEFFNSIGRIDAQTNQFHVIGDFGANEFADLVIARDGSLYASTTFGSEIYRIDPYTGASDLFAVFDNLDDLAVDENGDILVLASSLDVDPIEGIYQIDVETGAMVSLFDETDPEWNSGFRSPTAIGVAYDGLWRAVPEPSTAGILLIAGTAALFIRRRRS